MAPWTDSHRNECSRMNVSMHFSFFCHLRPRNPSLHNNRHNSWSKWWYSTSRAALVCTRATIKVSTWRIEFVLHSFASLIRITFNLFVVVAIVVCTYNCLDKDVQVLSFLIITNFLEYYLAMIPVHKCRARHTGIQFLLYRGCTKMEPS